MSESKPVRKKKGALWMVLTDHGDGMFQKVYAGPDKTKAREHAARELREDKAKDGTVWVMRVSQAHTLTRSDLATMLPRDAF